MSDYMSQEQTSISKTLKDIQGKKPEVLGSPGLWLLFFFFFFLGGCVFHRQNHGILVTQVSVHGVAKEAGSLVWEKEKLRGRDKRGLLRE